MTSTAAELQARQAIAKMRSLREQVQLFTTRAKMFNAMSGNIDSRQLLEQATQLVKDLGSARLEFLGPSGKIDTLARSLPSRPLPGTGFSPAAQLVPELRAAAKQFEEAVRQAETAVLQFRDTARDALNSPTRTATPPDNLLELILGFVELLTRWIESRKAPHQ